MQDGKERQEVNNDKPNTNIELVDSDIQQTEEVMRVNQTPFPFPDLLPLNNKQNETTNLKEVEMTEINKYGVENIKKLYGTLAEIIYSGINALGNGFQAGDLMVLVPILPELFSIGTEISNAKLELGDIITKEEEEDIINTVVAEMPFENDYDKELVGLIAKQTIIIQQGWHNRAMKAAEKANTTTTNTTAVAGA